jgi:peroxiredoxin
MAVTPSTAEHLAAVIEAKKTKNGQDLAALSQLSPVLLVFLRHAGCMFCREAVADLSRLRRGLEVGGVRIVLVHFGRIAAMERLLRRAGLGDLDTIYDSDRSLYRAFGLRRGKAHQVFGIRVWRRVLSALRRHGAGVPAGDPFQMPGVFLIHHCEVLYAYRHRMVSDRPDYEGIVNST